MKIYPVFESLSEVSKKNSKKYQKGNKDLGFGKRLNFVRVYIYKTKKYRINPYMQNFYKKSKKFKINRLSS